MSQIFKLNQKDFSVNSLTLLFSCSLLLRDHDKDKYGRDCGFTRKQLFSERNKKNELIASLKLWSMGYSVFSQEIIGLFLNY